MDPVKKGKEEDEDVVMTQDDDIFEDSADFDMSKIDRKMWLLRVPRFLMERWKEAPNKMGDNKDLGTVRIKQMGQKLKVKMLLNDISVHENIPKEYDLNMSGNQTQNTFVFSEEEDKVTNTKKTGLYGTVFNDVTIIPAITDKNYDKVVSERRSEIFGDKPRPKVTLINDNESSVKVSAGPSMRGRSSMFLKNQRKEHQRRQMIGKATRMPRNELLDLLFRLFEQYDYWGLRGLKERTKQPEVYLKEVLDHIATFHKTGPYALKYSLKPDYAAMKKQRMNNVLEDDNDKDKDERTDTPK
ncbi:hypothetical protein CANCADRAFT_3446 [Tortispora caseinolytica NRRL Y-17796]|uniref:Transcription initiation factor IIF subunit beta n=1 Tax=Tortispora caseinolytica NRRL Y-17796 TaxID=767744 RepID=A0A1E4TAM5_9ASCO|nr:hypothetical protein CANCADRAFT_3446 [Tortispora caseinolytica NRRL Y-17796]